MIQLHDATSLHYDLRLEAGGTLKSWAVPKGPSLDPSDRRLAMQMPDHGLDYYDFEGVIPDGYGAGTVLVWDWGTYTNHTERHGHLLVSVEEALRHGKLSFELFGEKLRGRFALVRKGRGNEWLLIKKRDEHSRAEADPTELAPWSVKTGRVLDEVAEDEAAE